MKRRSHYPVVLSGLLLCGGFIVIHLIALINPNSNAAYMVLRAWEQKRALDPLRGTGLREVGL